MRWWWRRRRLRKRRSTSYYCRGCCSSTQALERRPLCTLFLPAAGPVLYSQDQPPAAEEESRLAGLGMPVTTRCLVRRAAQLRPRGSLAFAATTAMATWGCQLRGVFEPYDAANNEIIEDAHRQNEDHAIIDISGKRYKTASPRMLQISAADDQTPPPARCRSDTGHGCRSDTAHGRGGKARAPPR